MNIEQPIPSLKKIKFQVMATWVWNVLAVVLISIIVMQLLPELTILNEETLLAKPSLVLIPIITEIVAV